MDTSRDIQRVKYSSNGETLDTTLSLDGEKKETPSVYGASTQHMDC